MKKMFFSMVVLASLTLGACQQNAKHDHANQPDAAAPANTDAANNNQTTIEQAAVYACPMKCEGEKTYTEAGKCPVCKMDLEVVTDAGNDQ